VFADLGFADAVERQARLRLAYAVNEIVEGRKVSQAVAAKVLGLTQSKVSALRRYKLGEFSVDTLINLLTALDQDVETEFDGGRVRGRLAGLPWWPLITGRCHETFETANPRQARWSCSRAFHRGSWTAYRKRTRTQSWQSSASLSC
jgi:predicted XRE-type DNA-binding protein